MRNAQNRALRKLIVRITPDDAIQALFQNVFRKHVLKDEGRFRSRGCAGCVIAFRGEGKK